MRTLVGGSRKGLVGLVLAMLLATGARSYAGQYCSVDCFGCHAELYCSGGCGPTIISEDYCEISGYGCYAGGCACDGSGGSCYQY